MKKNYLVTDLGPGDGGKGGVVHKISHMRKAHAILKVGGAQGSHGVSTSGGDRFAFSQFGCGTFEGVRTYLTPRFVASPEGILNEADALRYGHGFHDIFRMLTADEEVICATPYHGIASRVKELARKDHPRGTIGTGVGEAYRYSQRYPDLTIRFRDLGRDDLRDRIAAIRERVIADLVPLKDGRFLQEDHYLLENELDRLNDHGLLDYTVRRFSEAGRLVKTVDREYLRKTILAREGTVVTESSHGVLTDHYSGFHPHTSAIRTLPRFARGMFEELGYDGEMISIGVTRAYQIRHGAGPMPTADESMAENLLPGSCKEENRWQGKVRVGPLDLMLLRYAIEASGGASAFDGLAVTWFDQIRENGIWHICDSYYEVSDRTFLTSTGGIKVRSGEDDEQLSYQERLGKIISGSKPEITGYTIVPGRSRNELYDLCARVIGGKTGVSVRMVSFGPTELDKVCR